MLQLLDTSFYLFTVPVTLGAMPKLELPTLEQCHTPQHQLQPQ